MIHFVTPASGAFTLSEYLAGDRPETARRFQTLLYEDLPFRNSFARGTYVLAGLERLGPDMERLVEQLSDQLGATEGVRVLNDPRRSLRRYDLLALLHRSGRNPFKALRATEDLSGLTYPVFLREEITHGGNVSPLLDSYRQLEAAIGLALVQGRALENLLVVEFCSTANAEGIYRKYAAFKVGRRIMGRALYHGRHWMLKFSGSEYTRDFVLEEQNYVVQNPHAERLAEIFELAHVGYGQIDYSMKDDSILTWEINLNPTIGRGVDASGGPGPVELHPIRTETREYFFDRFREAWDEVELPGDSGASIPVSYDPEILAAVARGTRRGGFAERFRRLLRPLKPLLVPVSKPFLRLLVIGARAARRRRG